MEVWGMLSEFGVSGRLGGVLQSLNPRVPGGGPTWGSQPPSRPNCSHMGTPRAPFCPPVVLTRAAAVSECPYPHSVCRMGSPWFLSTPQPQTCPCMAVLVVPQPPVSPGASLYGGPSCSMSSPVSPGVSPYGGPSCSMSPPRGVLTGRSPQSLFPPPFSLPKGGVPTLCPLPPGGSSAGGAAGPHSGLHVGFPAQLRRREDRAAAEPPVGSHGRGRLRAAAGAVRGAELRHQLPRHR